MKMGGDGEISEAIASVVNLIDLRVVLQFSSSSWSWWYVSRHSESQSWMQWH